MWSFFEGNFSRAANVLHVSESTLSRQIQNLEEELNTQLLLRGNRSLKLTDSRQYLYSRTLEILQMAENTANTIQSGEKVVGNLHIGVGENYMETPVARAFAKLVKKYPDIKVNLHNITGDATPNKVGLALTFDKKEYHEPNSSFAFLSLKDFALSTSKMIWKKGRKQTKLEKLFLTQIKKEIKQA